MRKFTASNAAMLMSCHAAADLDSAIPGWQEPVRDDAAGAKGVGTRAHATFAEVNEMSAKDMQFFADSVAYVAELRSTRRFKVLIEHTMKATWLPSGHPTTADLVLYTQDEIHVLDLKWGKIEVDVYDNAQLMFYAVTYGQLAPKAKGVTVHILQPRAGGFASTFVTTDELKIFMDKAIATDQAINAGSLTFGPSDHCMFCAAYPHSRGDKGTPLCPVTLNMLYPKHVDEDEILSL